MKTKKDKLIQVLVDEETFNKMNKLIMMEAIKSNTSMQGKSGWVRNLIEDTVNFELNKQHIEEWKPQLIKMLQSK